MMSSMRSLFRKYKKSITAVMSLPFVAVPTLASAGEGLPKYVKYNVERTHNSTFVSYVEVIPGQKKETRSGNRCPEQQEIYQDADGNISLWCGNPPCSVDNAATPRSEKGFATIWVESDKTPGVVSGVACQGKNNDCRATKQFTDCRKELGEVVVGFIPLRGDGPIRVECAVPGESCCGGTLLTPQPK